MAADRLSRSGNVSVLCGHDVFSGALLWNADEVEAATARKNWEPDLEPRPDVHVLGSDYPQKDTEFLQHLVKRSYTVPKDPEEYAKIFVPTKDRKGSQNERS